MKTSSAQRASVRKWAKNHPEHNKYINYRSKTKQFLREMVQGNDLKEIEELLQQAKQRLS